MSSLGPSRFKDDSADETARGVVGILRGFPRDDVEVDGTVRDVRRTEALSDNEPGDSVGGRQPLRFRALLRGQQKYLPF